MSAVPPQDIAVCLVYLKDGFFQEADKPENKDKYEHHAGLHSGHIGIISDLYAYALWIENLLCEKYEGVQEWPGVFHYEVTEDLGKWLFENPNHFENEKSASYEFIAHATDVISLWFVTGRLTQ